MFPHYQIYISDSPNPCIHFIEYIFNHHQTRPFISPHTHFPSPFRGRLRIHGRDESDPYSCERPANYVANTPQTLNVHPRNASRNTPPGVGADSSCPYPNITKYTYPHYQIRISTLPHTHFPSHFVCVYVYTGTINRPLRLRTDCDNAADGLQQCCEQIAIYTRTPTKHHTFTPQKPYFYTTKTILLHRKNLSATNWEGRKNVLLKSSL